MTAQPVSGSDHRLVELLADAHQHALDALDAGNAMDAVVWLSAHVAACQHTVHRSAAHMPDATRALGALRAADVELEHMLRRAEQHHAGDVLAAQLDEDRLDHVLRHALERHARAERTLVEGLVERLDDGDVDQLMASYDDALRHAPTRPHPHTPHRGLLGALAFRVDAIRDKVMDTMDGRHVPAPRVSREPTRPGRWGSYVLGEMQK
jgi:CHAD domain-containing protein